MKRVTFSLRTLLILIAIAALLMALTLVLINWARAEYRALLDAAAYNTGPDELMLAPGQHAVLVLDIHGKFDPSGQVRAEPVLDSGGLAPDTILVRPGTRVMVIKDYAVDRDDAYPDRSILVRIVDGESLGTSLLVRRGDLREVESELDQPTQPPPTPKSQPPR